ncbi:MAG: TonB family protein [Chlorobi bacterium]|nr:TonB family protein [Chlorobiota bacterium]
MSIQESLRYGAAELKRVYTRNLSTALGISIAFHLALIFLYVIVTNVQADTVGKAAPVAKIKLTTVAPPPVEDAPPPTPPPMIPPQLQTGGGGGGGVASRAGTPVAVPDALISPDVKEFANTTELAVATPEGGDGTGFGPKTDGEGLGTAIPVDKPVEVKDKEKLPEPDEFVEAENEPQWDQSELQRRIKYPEIAQRNNIEGTVVIRALVDTHGKVAKTMVDRSDNSLLTPAAVDAVKATTFTPATQNHSPVAVWVQIPVKFKISN